MKTYTIGMTPQKILKKALPDIYTMELTRHDAELVTKLVNQGIDSHLEAITLAKPHSYTQHGKLKLSVTRAGMLCLLRRLQEESDREPRDAAADEMPLALDLRSSILYSIGIEEI